MQNAELQSIRELDGKVFLIPAYQRGFRWSRQQVQDLYMDLSGFSDPYDPAKKYCLQPIVLEETIKGEKTVYSVIDGQQRLTALYLLGAFYRCSSYYKEENINTFTNYQLMYEGKSSFQELLKIIGEQDFDIYDLVALKKDLVLWKEKYRDIDSQNVINILSYLCEKKPFGLLNKVFAALNDPQQRKDICIIWHKLETEDKVRNNAIEAFANINANKIPLTGAELIKAVMLQAYGKSREEANEERNNKAATIVKESSFANQWETIERGLNDAKFWGFFVRDMDTYKTRIDILFEIWLKKKGIPVPYGEHGLYRAVHEKIEKGNVKRIWDDILEIYEILQDWYKDYFYYHIIGCCSSLKRLDGVDNNADFVCLLFEKYEAGANKDDFRKYLLTFLGENLAKVVLNEKGKKDVSAALRKIRTLSYGDPATKDVLLVFNIALLLNAFSVCKQNTAERFPFAYYKDFSIEVEHINPKHPDKKTDESQAIWESNMASVIRDNGEKTIDDIVSAVWQSRYEEIERAADINTIGNLTLVDKKLNIGFSNEGFLEKRNHVLCAMFGMKMVDRDYSESTVFPGARWVFMREWLTGDGERSLPSQKLSCNLWSKQERKIYVNHIVESLSLLLGKEEVK